jgi:hypothetical protein
MLMLEAPGHDRHAPRSRARGQVGFRLLLVATVLLVPVLYTLTRSGTATDTTVIDPGKLHEFLEHGPTTGLWETRRLHDLRRAYFAPLPSDETRLLMAPAPMPAGMSQSYCKTCRHPCSYTRKQVLPFFFEAPAELFRRNYRLVEAPTRVVLPDEGPVYVATWRPRVDQGLLTERQAWFDAESGDLVRIEDYSRDGQVLRTVRRERPDTGEWNASSFDPRKDPVCMAEDRDPNMAGAHFLEMRRRAGFPLARPMTLPPGFELIRAQLREVPVPRSEGDDDPEEILRVATLTYSDGMALLSFGIAPPDVMDLLERITASMEASVGVPDDAQNCPTLPAQPVDLREPAGLIRMRTNRCRTVLRRDQVGGVSVTLLGRNELPFETYRELILGLEVLPIPE